MNKLKLELESTFCVDDIKGLPVLLEMFKQTAELEGNDRKTKKYKIVIEEI
jgi:hypothetical protein